jgi:hypothetical protein
LEVWNEPVGTALTQSQWQSGVQAAIAQYRLAGTTMYDGPVFVTTRNWGWTVDVTEATAIKNLDSNVVFCTHRLAAQSPTMAPLPTTDVTGSWQTLANNLNGAGLAHLMALYGVYNGGYGTGGTKDSNAQTWGAAMAAAIQQNVSAGKLVGGLGWMWMGGFMQPGENDENSGIDPGWSQVVAGASFTYNAWGNVVNGMISNLAGGIATPPPSGSPTITMTVPSSTTTGTSVTVAATATPFSGTTITNVVFAVDGTVIFTDTTSPYSTTWTAAAGQHTITATANQSDGKATTVTQTVIVTTSTATAPLNGFKMEVSGTAFIDAAGNRTVARGTAQYLVEYVLSGSGAGSLYSWFTSHITAVAQEWASKGANLVRIPITYNTASAYYNDLKAKVDALWAQGICSIICAFDGAQYPVSSATSATRMKQMWDLIGSPSYCFIETTNEPSGIDAATWQGYMNTWRSTLRSAGYKGIIFMGARDWSWTCDPSTFQAVKNADVAVSGSKPGNVAFVCHRYAVTDPANAVQPSNDGDVWRGLWPDQIGPLGVCGIIDEWGPWNGGSISPGAYGVGGSYDYNVNTWGENMRQNIQNAVQAGNFGGALGWMWAWSDNNTMTGSNPEAANTSYVEGTTGGPWIYNQWGQKMWSLVQTLGGTPTLPGNPTVTHSAPSTAQTGNIVTITASPTSGGPTVTISKVELVIDNVVTAVDTTAPYTFTWTATTGTHTIAVRATQSDGKIAVSAATNIVVTTTTPPSGGAGLLHVSGKSIKDASNNVVFLRGLNQYIATPYWDCGSGCFTTQYLSDWFDSNIGRVAADWYAQGVRHCRFPVNCADTSTSYKDKVKNIVQQIIAKGIYVSLNGFGGLGNYGSSAGSVGTYLANLWSYCGSPAMCMINLWNEPHDGSNWTTASNAGRAAIRSAGYTGIIFLDADGYATVYDPTAFNSLLSSDSSFSGNIAFSVHRYHALCNNSSYPAGYLPDNWCSTNLPGNWFSGAFATVMGEYGFHNCYNQRDDGGGGTNWINWLNDATNTIIAAKSAGNCAGAWAWMWTWDANSLVDPSQYNITQGAVWSYNTWGQIAKRMWANTAVGI